MKNIILISVLILSSSALFGAGITQNAQKAKSMVRKAVEFYKANGREAAFKAFNDTKGLFRSGEYYVFVFDFDGVCLARGDGNSTLIGVNEIEMKDPDGKLYIKEMLETARDKNSGWVDYKRSNPRTKKVENKSSYVEKVDNIWIGCGFYK
jgi:signal transduction histidine kinase